MPISKNVHEFYYDYLRADSLLWDDRSITIRLRTPGGFPWRAVYDFNNDRGVIMRYDEPDIKNEKDK